MDYLLLIIAAVTQFASVYWGLTTPLKEQRGHAYRLRLAAAAGIGILCLAILGLRERSAKAQPDYDYAYLVPAGTANDQVLFFFKSTHNIDVLDVALWVTKGSFQRRDRFEHIRQGAQADTIYPLAIGDWTLDIDAPGEHGKMLQHLIIERKDGIPVVTFSRVTEKGTHGLRMCQTPRTQLGISLC
jgi:hypothetical protein